MKAKLPWFLVIALAVTLASCGPAAKLRRAERLIAEAEAQGATVTMDTIFVDKLVITAPTQFDTVLSVVGFGDTLTIEKEKIVTRIKVNTVTKEIFVETKCPPDTIKINVPYTVTRKISARDGYSMWQMIILALVFLLVGYGVRAFVKSRS
jgi:hypothetical protein